MEPSAKITKFAKKEETKHDWWCVDASGMTVGRLATRVASLLRGKHKPWFTPHTDTGDFVIILNAEKVIFEGKRAEMKEYKHHTGYPGGQITQSFKQLIKTKPEFVIEHAIKGMIPKNRLGRQIIKKLKVYAGNEHPHVAQQPKELTFTN